MKSISGSPSCLVGDTFTNLVAITPVEIMPQRNVVRRDAILLELVRCLEEGIPIYLPSDLTTLFRVPYIPATHMTRPITRDDTNFEMPGTHNYR
jgi:hypothetical protein